MVIEALRSRVPETYVRLAASGELQAFAVEYGEAMREEMFDRWDSLMPRGRAGETLQERLREEAEAIAQAVYPVVEEFLSEATLLAETCGRRERH